MLTTALFFALALAGELVVHAEVPVEVAVDGHTLVQVFRDGRVHLPVTNGERRVTLLINGSATRLRLQFGEEHATHVMVGRTGITTRKLAQEPAPEGVLDVELRAVGLEGVSLRVAGQTYQLSPGDQQHLELGSGRHSVQLRSSSGQVIYASGQLEIDGGGPIVVQVSEGRAPEVIGAGARWRPADR